MANTYFQFKQFVVHQELCGMKVSTDACVFGAWLAGYYGSLHRPLTNILDIGTGTGLLSLMVAQQTNAVIDAIDIDGAAFHQAGANFTASPWSHRLKAHHDDLLVFNPTHLYDAIFSNPPFYEQDLKTGNFQKDAARHDVTLRLHQLLAIAGKHLAPTGTLALLLPQHRLAYCKQLAIETGYFLQQEVLIQHSLQHPFSRGILVFSKQPCVPAAANLALKDDLGNYTDAFIRLMQGYYLYL